MKAAVKKKWIEALKSGDYKRARWALHPTKDTFCPIGILCDLHLKETKGEWVGPTEEDDRYGYPSAGGAVRAFMPKEVAKWSGYKEVVIADGKKELTLSWLSDQEEYDFEKIADLIEENL